MASEKFSYDPPPAPTGHTVKEQNIESEFIEKLCSLKHIHRSDIHDRASLAANFREKFEELNRVRLTDSEFARLLDETIKRNKQRTKRVQRSVFLSLN